MWIKTVMPVLPTRSGKWDSFCVRELVLVIDEKNNEVLSKNNILTAYYCGKHKTTDGWQIGVAKSIDDGLTWNRLDDPIIKPSYVHGSWCEKSIGQPWVIKNNNEFMMMATGQGETVNLGVLTSLDGLSWVDKGSKLSLEQFHYDKSHGIIFMGVPCVIKRSSNDYFMVFEGRKKDVPNAWRIFAATSSAFTGKWIPYNNGYPIFCEDIENWENAGVANPKLVEYEPHSFVLAYNGIGHDGKWRVGTAKTKDFLKWIRNPSNPIIVPSFAWDSFGVECSFFAKENNYFQRLYFQGYSSGSESQVGLAIQKQQIESVKSVIPAMLRYMFYYLKRRESFVNMLMRTLHYLKKKKLVKVPLVTQYEIASGLRELGLSNSDVVFVHSSLSSFGNVSNGAPTIIDALFDVVGKSGTIIMPSFTSVGTPFDVRKTEPCKDMGVIAKTLFHRKGSKRSLHPTHSVVAIGANADYIVSGHEKSLTPFGENTPFDKMLKLKSYILLLGVKQTVNTSVHMIEDMTKDYPYPTYFNGLFETFVKDYRGKTLMVKTNLFNPSISKLRDVNKIEPYLEQYDVLKKTKIGNAEVRLMKMADLIRVLGILLEKGITIYTEEEKQDVS
jgi:aminoglycoside 3-N-acetyltransferase